MNTTAMLRAFCDAVEQRNGAAFAALFTEDGVYHDVFYGAFTGRAKIAEMIDDWFYRTAADFRWERRADALRTLYIQLPLIAAGSQRRARCSRASRS
jgi:limonene-1,2-epoxide hydrolase